MLFFSWSVKSISSNNGIEVIRAFVISIFNRVSSSIIGGGMVVVVVVVEVVVGGIVVVVVEVVVVVGWYAVTIFELK